MERKRFAFIVFNHHRWHNSYYFSFAFAFAFDALLFAACTFVSCTNNFPFNKCFALVQNYLCFAGKSGK